MMSNILFIIVSASLVSGSVLAGTMGSKEDLSSKTWVGTLSVGPV